MNPVAARVFLGAGILAVAGCGVILGVDSDRYVTAGEDAAVKGDRGDAATDAGDAATVHPPDGGIAPAAASDWSCLNQPREQLDPNLRVSLTLLVMDPIQGSTAAGAIDGGSDLDTIKWDGLPGVSVRACALRDTNCDDPSPIEVTDDAGAAAFLLSGDFSGFFDLHRADLVPATLYPGNLLAGQTVANFPAYDIGGSDLQGLAKLGTGADATLDADGGVGHVAVTIYDCQDHQAPAVSVAFDKLGARGVPFYFKDGLPSTSVTQTDGYGLAGAIDVPVGTRMVTATLASNARQIGTIAFDVRPGGLTFAWIRVRSR